MSGRPGRAPVSVVVPFAGSAAEGTVAIERLKALRVRPGDQKIVVDNSADGVLSSASEAGVEVVPASAQRSSYYARNCGAERARGEWLLFIDADCVPPPDLIERYFDDEPAADCAVVAGAVRARGEQTSLISRYARSRGHINSEFHLDRPPFPAGITANLLVRRAAWESIGGFQEGIRSGGDLDLCWRLQSAGWGFEYCPDAVLEHEHVETLAALIAKTRRHAAGRMWLSRAWPGSFARPHLSRALLRCLLAAIAWTLTLRWERAAFKCLDAAWALADQQGYLLGDNRAEAAGAGRGRRAPRGADGRSLLLLTDAFPARSETFIYREVQALQGLGLEVRVESSARPERTERAVAREIHIDYLGDVPPGAKARDLAWLAVRHPLRVGRDATLRRRMRAEEPRVWSLAAIAPAARRLIERGERHIHVHFAAGAAGHALRVARLAGASYSVVGHGYDLFREPRNLPLKLSGAALLVAPCAYTAAQMTALAPGASRPEVVVMGVDSREFTRALEPPDAGVVVAIGRLVPKKGFADLLRAAALADPQLWRRLIVVGDGPLRAELSELARELGLGERFERLDAWGHREIRAILERADLLAMPAVIAPDGDRDAMPVVVKEAMAMELPVVASDEVGLPEIVRDEWGRLVPPGDPQRLAAAVIELLSLPSQERREMGRRARAHVKEHCETATEAARLAALLAPLMRG